MDDALYSGEHSAREEVCAGWRQGYTRKIRAVADVIVKVWAKRRRINSPYRGTLSSCEYPTSPLREPS